MKTENIFIQGINQEITFYIGKNQNENFDVIDMGSENDLWFHANNISSCHIVAIIPENIAKNELKYIIKAGALLCKINTNKLKNLKDVEIIYSQLKNVEKTSIPGCVEVIEKKIIRI